MSFLAKLKNWFSSKPKKGATLPKIDLKKRFDFLNRTGQGSMSRVWRARDNSLGRLVCLKLLDKDKTARFESRFLGMNKPLEGAICLVLKHKNIVQTFEHGLSTEGEHYIVMELIEGTGLNFLVETNSDRLHANRLDYLVQLTNGVEYLHNQGYMHRDICPRNIMITKDDVVKIIDFGLSVPTLPAFTKPGNRTGTPNYLAPEIIRRSNTDPRIDLFALGVTAFELFCNQLPWEKTDSLQTLVNHMNSPGKDPREFLPDLDSATAELLIKATEREPSKRFQTSAEFREALLKLPKRR